MFVSIDDVIILRLRLLILSSLNEHVQMFIIYIVFVRYVIIAIRCYPCYYFKNKKKTFVYALYPRMSKVPILQISSILPHMETNLLLKSFF